MQKLDLDYATSVKSDYAVFAWAALLFGLLLMIGLMMHYRSVSAQLQTFTQQNMVTETPVAKKVDPQLQEKLATLLTTQNQLNFPWRQSYIALETVQKNYPNIALLSVTANPGKKEILLTGETSNFEALTHYLRDLKASNLFDDAILLNQRLDDASDNKKRKILFTLSVGWRL